MGSRVSGAARRDPAHRFTLNAQVTDTGKDSPVLITVRESQIP